MADSPRVAINPPVFSSAEHFQSQPLLVLLSSWHSFSQPRTMSGQGRNNQTVESLVEELERFCRSDDLSLDALLEKTNSIPQSSSSVQTSSFFHRVCENERVTLEIVEFILDTFPAAAHAATTSFCPNPDNVTTAYPLHVACYIQACPKSILELLVEKNPSALSHPCDFSLEVPHNGFLHGKGIPLHYYLMRTSNINLDTVKMLVEAYPKALESGAGDDESGAMPIIHTLARNPTVNTLADVLQFIRSVNPASLRLTDGCGRVPLHVACTNKNMDSSIVQLLLGAWPESIQQRDKDEQLPIHELCLNEGINEEEESLKTLSLLVEMYPQSVMKPDAYGRLPIHLAARNKPHSSIVRLLLDAWPESIQQRDRHDQVPIHGLCENEWINEDESLKILSLLVEMYPQSVMEPDDYGRLPIHLAVRNKTHSSFVQLLLDAWPESIQQRDRHEQLLIHELCKNEWINEYESLKILSLLVEMYPQSVMEPDIRGNLPIHLAATNKSPRFCKALIDTFPASLRMESGDGNLPMHIAFAYQHLETVKHMLELHPESMNTRNRSGYLPIHMAAMCTGKEKTDIISVLLLKDPLIASKPTTGQKRNLPLHLTCYYNKKNLKAVKLLFDAYPEAIITNNGDGNSPLDVLRGRNSKAIRFLRKQVVYAQQAHDMSTMTTLDRYGWLPLHHALHNRAPLGSIKLLVKGNPCAIRVYDNQLLFPFHIACEFSTAGIVQFLVELDGFSLNICHMNIDSPLHYACRGGNCKVVKYLLGIQASAVSKRNGNNKLPIHLLWECEEDKVDRESPEYVETIWRLILANPDETLLNFD